MKDENITHHFAVNCHDDAAVRIADGDVVSRRRRRGGRSHCAGGGGRAALEVGMEKS